MTVSRLSEIEIQQKSWTDVRLRSLSWTNDGRDLTFEMILPEDVPLSERNIALHCRWASNLNVALSFRENVGGFPLTWDITFNRVANSWRVEFAFAGVGLVSLCCSEIELEQV